MSHLFIRMQNEWLCDDSKDWSYEIKMEDGYLVIDTTQSGDTGGKVHLQPGPHLEGLIRLLKDYGSTGALPEKSSLSGLERST